MKRLRDALRKAYDIGYEHGRARLTGRNLANAFLGEHYYGDRSFLRNAYSAGIWDHHMNKKRQKEIKTRGQISSAAELFTTGKRP